jgi:putative endonuclease
VTEARRELGRAGEEAAAGHLVAHGWRVLARGWRAAGREIDLVVEKEGLVALVEVKTRRAGSLTPPAAAVDWRKRRQLAAAGAVAVARWSGARELRFDVIGVTWGADGPAIEHLEDAFRP